jgi:ATP-binding cassette subfamily C protein
MKAKRLFPAEFNRTVLRQALQQFRNGFVGVGLFSALINILMLTGSLFMLQVYDRVLPSKSVPTLMGLALIVAGLYGFQALLDVIRTRVLVRIGSAFDESLTTRAYAAVIDLTLKGARASDAGHPIRDLDNVRSFLTGSGPVALFDLPWMPFYLGLCFLFHWYLGLAATVGAAIVISVALLTEVMSRGHIGEAAALGASRSAFAEASRSNSEVFHALGMLGRMAARWHAENEQFCRAQQRVSDVTGGLGAIAKVLRLGLQSAVLGVGAYLVIHQQSTAGIIIASSIISARALAPVDIAIANWRGFVAARHSWRRLNHLLAALPVQNAVLPLPKPTTNLVVENVSVIPPGSRRTVIQGVTFNLNAGSALGIIGPSAAGKSSLVKAVLGVWPAIQGSVRIDGAEFTQWSRDVLGSHLGYLAQDVSLIDGTVAQNISRFEPAPVPEAIIAAAKAAGVHELILNLPDGYETKIGERGEVLSAGHRQRIGLARALYGDPFLVVLDEPNSNLDSDGEQALAQAIRGVCKRGGIVIVIAHRPSVLSAVDYVLAMSNGQMRAFGPRDEVLAPKAVGATLQPVAKVPNPTARIPVRMQG